MSDFIAEISMKLAMGGSDTWNGNLDEFFNLLKRQIEIKQIIYTSIYVVIIAAMIGISILVISKLIKYYSSREMG